MVASPTLPSPPAAAATALTVEAPGSRAHPAVAWLPDPALGRTVDDAAVSVFMDWGRGNLAFTLANYRSLESVLAHHPNADVKVQSVAPVSAAMYRYANTLSWTQFKKYLKRGYSVEIELASSASNVYAGSRDRFDRPSANLATFAEDLLVGAKKPGEAYWNAIKVKCCEAPFGFNEQRKVEDSRLVPGHLNFLRLVRLWPSGGVYLGFSFLLGRPLPHGQRVVDLGPRWADAPTGPAPPSHREDTLTSPGLALTSSGVAAMAAAKAAEKEKEGEGEEEDDVEGQDYAHPAACGNEMLLQLPARDPLLGCVLAGYGDHFGVDGDVDPKGPCGNGKGGAGLSGYEHPSVAQLRQLHDRPKKGTGQDTSTWYLGYDGVDTEYEAAAVRSQACLRVLFRGCLAKRADGTGGDPGAAGGALRTGAVEWHGCDLETLHERFHGEDHPHQHVFASAAAGGGGGVAALEADALHAGGDSGDGPGHGGGGSGGSGGQHEEDRQLPPAAKRASLAESLQHARRPLAAAAAAAAATTKEEGAAAKSAGVSEPGDDLLGFWIGPPALDGVWKEPASGTALDARFAHVHAGLTRWGKMGEAGAACLQPRNCSSFATGGAWAESPVDLQAAKFRCAPSFIIPGTQKGASTFLFHALSRHPQVVPPLRGAHGYKEAGAYVLQNCRRKDKQIGNRVHRFPFLEPDEPFATGDGTVHYMVSCPAIPGEIVRDNPAVRVIFALRDPIGRAWSDYRFAAQWYKNKGWGFNDVVDGTLGDYARCLDRFHNGSYLASTRPSTGSGGGGGLRGGGSGHKADKPMWYDEYFVPASAWLPASRLAGGEEAALDAGTKAFYQERCDTALGDNHNLIKKSLYLFQVRHWVSVLGHARVRVVTTEDIIKDQKAVLRDTLAFVGLCPFNFGNLGKDNVTPFDVQGKFRINEESFVKLQAFFRPYNELLYKLVGRDLGWEAGTFAKYKKR